MESDYKVKGSSIRSKFDFVRERYGAAAERELRESFGRRPGLLPVLDSAWYPFSVYDELNRAIADRFYGGDLAKLEEVGAYSAGKVLTTVYKAFASGKDYAGFLQRAAILHERFYNRGRMIVAIGADRRSAEVHLAEAPTYSEADLYVAAGFYAGAGKLLGLEGVEYELRLEDDGAHFDLKWGAAPE